MSEPNDRKMTFDGGYAKIEPLTEGYLRKGGVNPAMTGAFVRPAPPAPMRAADPQPASTPAAAPKRD
jgi:hypothetical protein